jgi:hypothetical protein
MIRGAEARGELAPGKTILEATSGNTGIGLALVAAAKGYRLCLAMSEAVSDERKKILKAMGAELVFTPASQGTDGAIEVSYAMLGSIRSSITDRINSITRTTSWLTTRGRRRKSGNRQRARSPRSSSPWERRERPWDCLGASRSTTRISASSGSNPTSSTAFKGSKT